MAISSASLIPFPNPPQVKLKNKHSKVINLLSKIAINVDPIGSARIAAAVVYKGTVIAIGTNKRKTHPFQAQFGKNKDCIQLHAEIDVIKNALKFITQFELSRSTLYICRVKYYDESKKDVIFGLAKPCSGCERAIATFNIKKVIYSLDNEGYAEL